MPEEEDPVPRLVAGFIVWLAAQRYEQDHRDRCPLIAERFVRWQTRRARQVLPRTINAHCRELCLDGASEDRLSGIRHVARDLDKFRATASRRSAASAPT